MSELVNQDQPQKKRGDAQAGAGSDVQRRPEPPAFAAGGLPEGTGISDAAARYQDVLVTDDNSGNAANNTEAPAVNTESNTAANDTEAPAVDSE